MQDLKVSMSREAVDVELLRGGKPLPAFLSNLNFCTPYVFCEDDRVVAQCLVKKDETYEGLYNVTDYSAESDAHLQYALQYVLQYYRDNGGRYVDIGCGNAELNHYALLQKVGFRVLAVAQDWFANNMMGVQVQHSIVNRDLVCFRIDLHEKTLTTIGYDASGWK